MGMMSNKGYDLGSSKFVFIQRTMAVAMLPHLESYVNKASRPSWNICIFSRDRSDKICQTLRVLFDGGIKPEHIYVFVAPAEMEVYEPVVRPLSIHLIRGAEGSELQK
jgi:hypothetical protein